MPSTINPSSIPADLVPVAPNTTRLRPESAIPISLELTYEENCVYPAPTYLDAAKDMVPWRMAMWRRDDLIDLVNPDYTVGNRPKRAGFYYRFTGGNAILFDNDDPDQNPPLCYANDGDFEVETKTGDYFINIKIITPGWEFDKVDLFLDGPTLSQVGMSPDKTEMRIKDSTNYKLAPQSGQIGMIVKLPVGNQDYGFTEDVYIYVDPDWDNRN